MSPAIPGGLELPSAIRGTPQKLAFMPRSRHEVVLACQAAGNFGLGIRQHVNPDRQVKIGIESLNPLQEIPFGVTV